MVIDRPQYIELYSIAMEEVRHHHRLYTETWIAGIFMTSAFFAGLYFLSRFLSTVPSLASMPFRLFVIILGSLVMTAFYGVTMRRGVIAETCRETAKELEGILAGETDEKTFKIGDLLLTRKIEALRKQRRHLLRKFFRWPWLFFLIAFLILWIWLCGTVLTVT